MPKPRWLGETKTSGGRGVHDPVVDGDATQARALETRDGSERRRLAAAAWPEQRKEMPLGHGEAHVLRGFHGLATGCGVFGKQAVDCQQRLPESYSLTPYFLPSHCAISTSTNSAMMNSTPSAESSTYWPFSHSSQITMDITWVSGL